jgi:hypothetical protein
MRQTAVAAVPRSEVRKSYRLFRFDRAANETRSEALLAAPPAPAFKAQGDFQS